MVARSAQLKPRRRRITAAILFAGCLGFGAAASDAIRSSFVGTQAEMAIVTGLSLVLFFFTALAGYALAANVLRGPEGEAMRTAAPTSLLGWCASCGERVTDQLICPVCRHPLSEQDKRWTCTALGPED